MNRIFVINELCKYNNITVVNTFEEFQHEYDKIYLYECDVNYITSRWKITSDSETLIGYLADKEEYDLLDEILNHEYLWYSYYHITHICKHMLYHYELFQQRYNTKIDIFDDKSWVKDDIMRYACDNGLDIQHISVDLGVTPIISSCVGTRNTHLLDGFSLSTIYRQCAHQYILEQGNIPTEEELSKYPKGMICLHLPLDELS